MKEFLKKEKILLILTLSITTIGVIILLIIIVLKVKDDAAEKIGLSLTSFLAGVYTASSNMLFQKIANKNPENQNNIIENPKL